MSVECFWRVGAVYILGCAAMGRGVPLPSTSAGAWP